ncbi:zinc finger CCCH domain-containing protein 18-like isoform X2 [Cicer arietinum]|uniref:Zinc finger CCCH domain-containing protein 18-like isoform X2 n=1 Tax=Cicer arietinum TaxID=3827 RepID=A0A1S2XM85_CICAR|nr:zinc finger CCCH domain-containing protein 18-like isoform X2 [Cicer arietinum]
MDISDYTRIVYDRIQKFEPENAAKIIGYILMQEHGDQELARLASCTDHIFYEVVSKAKTEIHMMAVKSLMTPISPPPLPPPPPPPPNVITPQQQGYRYLPPPPGFPVRNSIWGRQPGNHVDQEYMREIIRPKQLLCLESSHLDHVNTRNCGGIVVNDYNGLDASSSSSVDLGGNSSSRRLDEIQPKNCHYFRKGFCKHGSNCRYIHCQVPHESFPHDSANNNNNSNNNNNNEEKVLLAQIESEIIELLKQRRGNPISIASLPSAYYDKYKKRLEAHGYLTESKRHGKSGYSLTKLLVQLNSIRLIDRPHGQHSVILAEDAPKYIQKGDSVQNISASRQIYLTFPADSTFTEEDVAKYFNTIGFVEDVRIPCQEKRMFGFVTFADPKTVRMILDNGNPHYVCGSRVLVKPYRERARVERRHQDILDILDQLDNGRNNSENMNYECDRVSRNNGNHQYQRRQLIEEEEEQVLELERRRLAQLHFSQTRRPLPLPISPPLPLSPRLPVSSPSSVYSNFGFSIDLCLDELKDELKAQNDHFKFNSQPVLTVALDNNVKNTDKDSSEGTSNEGFHLPDSPFSFPTIESDIFKK